MHANGGVVPFHQVLYLVTRLDSQRFSNLPRNGRLSLAGYRGMRHREILILMMIPYPLNYSLLFVSWQGQALVSLPKLTQAERLQILGSVGLLETFSSRGHLADLRTCFRHIESPQRYIDQRRLDRRLLSLGFPPALS
jgi:hypothetical protein